MRVVREIGAKGPQDTPAAVAMGYFDGVHLGHAAVIGAAREAAQKQGLRLAVFTYTLQGETGVKGGRILTEEAKHARLAALGVDTCYEPAFAAFRSFEPRQFFEQMLLGQFCAQALFCGQDFAFGAKRTGDVALLGQLCGKHGVQLSIVPTAVYEGQAVSSSRIRAALQAGNMQAVNGMLGRPYEIDLPVKHGKSLGHKLGFPTINQSFPEGLVPPAQGVYITQTLAGGRVWPSATGWGTRPTVENSGAPTCETFIPGFEGDLYGQSVPVRFYKKIAGVQRFATREELAAAVQHWAAQATAFFA